MNQLFSNLNNIFNNDINKNNLIKIINQNDYYLSIRDKLNEINSKILEKRTRISTYKYKSTYKSNYNYTNKQTYINNPNCQNNNQLNNNNLDEVQLNNNNLYNNNLDNNNLDEVQLNNNQLDEVQLDNNNLDNNQLDKVQLDNVRLDNVRLDNNFVNKYELDFQNNKLLEPKINYKQNKPNYNNILIDSDDENSSFFDELKYKTNKQNKNYNKNHIQHHPKQYNSSQHHPLRNHSKQYNSSKQYSSQHKHNQQHNHQHNHQHNLQHNQQHNHQHNLQHNHQHNQQHNQQHNHQNNHQNKYQNNQNVINNNNKKYIKDNVYLTLNRNINKLSLNNFDLIMGSNLECIGMNIVNDMAEYLENYNKFFVKFRGDENMIQDYNFIRIQEAFISHINHIVILCIKKSLIQLDQHKLFFKYIQILQNAKIENFKDNVSKRVGLKVNEIIEINNSNQTIKEEERIIINNKLKLKLQQFISNINNFEINKHIEEIKLKIKQLTIDFLKFKYSDNNNNDILLNNTFSNYEKYQETNNDDFNELNLEEMSSIRLVEDLNKYLLTKNTHTNLELKKYKNEIMFNFLGYFNKYFGNFNSSSNSVFTSYLLSIYENFKSINELLIWKPINKIELENRIYFVIGFLDNNTKFIKCLDYDFYEDIESELETIKKSKNIPVSVKYKLFDTIDNFIQSRHSK